MDKLNEDFEIKETIEKIRAGELRLSSREIEELILSFNRDEDKIALLRYSYAPIKIIRTLESEESILSAIKELRTDEEKIKVILRFLKKIKIS